jgi:hypothetical protein
MFNQHAHDVYEQAACRRILFVAMSARAKPGAVPNSV